MTTAEAIHAAARHYCNKKSAEWKTEYARRSPSANEAYNLFPRYLVLDAILIELERFTAVDAPSVEQMLERAVLAAETARSGLTDNLVHNVRNEDALCAMNEERTALIRYIKSLSPQELEKVEPLPFRRVLNDEESKTIWQNLASRWNLDFPWYPLKEGEPPFRLLTFHTDYFDGLRRGRELLQNLLRRHGVTRVWELREFVGEPAYEQDVLLFEPKYRFAECCWTAPSFDWIVYASHESSITLAGDWLVAAIQKSWPDWDRRQYGGPFSTEDLRGTWEFKNGGMQL